MSERVKKWSPGPWVAGTPNIPSEYQTGIRSKCGYIVCDICSDFDQSDDPGYYKSNTALIAAAPALVEALEDMLADYRDACEEWDAENQEQGLEIIEKAEAALSLAYGETQ